MLSGVGHVIHKRQPKHFAMIHSIHRLFIDKIDDGAISIAFFRQSHHTIRIAMCMDRAHMDRIHTDRAARMALMAHIIRTILMMHRHGFGPFAKSREIEVRSNKFDVFRCIFSMSIP